ncbi:hypothetical protein C3486_09660 [Streptomyces sp. Ru73]|uniref:hypothetical protein n=1 Tax=Streptomyces sp. Ru73 TaxID=2080748 RepID=UPI000CDCEEA1|nr:hypothetical protein [Streptomyces sp. Ru73]POX41267.1 hypothetical protein C3486_09660 [Streptomyces sp. Ru73]
MPYLTKDPQQTADPHIPGSGHGAGNGGAGGHRTTTVERGAFCLARCSCGWSGPARRARSQARTDAGRHSGDDG